MVAFTPTQQGQPAKTQIDELQENLTDLAARLRFVPLATPLTSTAWDGDARSSSAGFVQLDLSAVFGVPAGVRAVLVRLRANDSAAWGTGNLRVTLGPGDGKFAVNLYTYGGDVVSDLTAPCPCDANGDIWYSIVASGAGTMDVHMQIYGYWL